MNFARDRYGFWKQTDPEPIAYDPSYRAVQKTTALMAGVRLGFLAQSLVGQIGVGRVAEFGHWNVVDVGAGNGVFAASVRPVFGRVAEFDLSGDTISCDELNSTEWDVAFLTDVLEHYSDVDDLFDIHARFFFVSYPETPPVSDWRQLQGWRHFRPNEHIYNLDAANMRKFFVMNGYRVIAQGNPEDMIRKYPGYYQINITTMIAERM